MARTTIEQLIVVPAPQTGMGWYAVQRWSARCNRYEHVATFRGADAAEEFIKRVGARYAPRRD